MKEEYANLYKIIELINFHLKTMKDSQKCDYKLESSSNIELELNTMFDRNQYMDFCHNAYYYAAHYFTAIIGNYLLIIYYIKYKNSDEAVVYDIGLIPNVDNISLELKSDYISTQARIVDGDNKAITIWTPFTNLEHKKTGKMSLSELLEPVTLEEMKNKIDMIILREKDFMHD